MLISDLIQEIVSTRNSRKEAFEKRKGQLELWKGRLANLIALDDKPLWNDIIQSIDSSDKWKYLLEKAMGLKENIDAFTSETGDFTLAHARATRDYVNIGAVGIYREGKSEFVANATQLKSDWIVPRQATNHACTTAPINIVNGPSKDGKQEIVRVYYYTVEQMVGIFADYIEELGEDPQIIIAKKISTRAQLVDWCISNKDMSFQNATAENKTELQKKFRLYREKIKCYVERLVESEDDKKYEDYQIIDIEKGGKSSRDYYSSVSYYQTPNDTDQHEVYTSFATKEAKVFTCFSIGDEENVEGIQFLDTPGIGEHKVGIEKLLRQAVSKDLDIIIGVRKIGPNTNNDQEQQMLLNVIRGSMATWKNANEWIYFLLNAFPGATINHANTTRDEIIDSLKILGVGGTSITLSESHFVNIDLKNIKELTANGYVENQPLERYIFSILKAFIPKIKDIDDGFYSLADVKYGIIERTYRELANLVNNLHLPIFSNVTDQINRRFVAINTKFKEVMLPALAEIERGLKDNIFEFCGMGEKSSEPVGQEVAKIFGVSIANVSSEPEELYEELCKLIAEKAKDDFKYVWNNNKEFIRYQELKCELENSMRKSIREKIDWERACFALQEAKNKFCDILMNEGNLQGVINSEAYQSQEDWLNLFISLIKAEGGYNNLIEVLENFCCYTLDPIKIFEDDINNILRKAIRHDKFDDQSFEGAEETMYAFISSLYNIEWVTKQTTQKTLVSDKVTKITESYYKIFSSAMDIVANQKIIGPQPERDQFEDFYRNHSYLLADSDLDQKQGLVDICKIICK